MSAERLGGTSSFYEIAAQLVTFLDNADLVFGERDSDRSGKNGGNGKDSIHVVYDK